MSRNGYTRGGQGGRPHVAHVSLGCHGHVLRRQPRRARLTRCIVLHHCSLDEARRCPKRPRVVPAPPVDVCNSRTRVEDVREGPPVGEHGLPGVDSLRGRACRRPKRGELSRRSGHQLGGDVDETLRHHAGVPVEAILLDPAIRRRDSVLARRRLLLDEPAQRRRRAPPGKLPLLVQLVQARDLRQEIRRELNARRYAAGDEAAVLQVLVGVAQRALRRVLAAA